MPRVKTRSMTRVRFHCGKCGTPVTRPVRHLADRSRISPADGTDYVPRGLYTFTCRDEDLHAGWVVHPREIVNSRYTRNPGHGCCGLWSGEDRNRRCHRWHEYGWEVTECYMGGRGVWLDPDRITLSDSDDAAPFGFTLVDPAWAAANGGTGLALARSIDNGGAFGDLPVLADALEEGGCDDPVVLGHLRSPGKHRGGCWFVDEILGKR